MKILVVSDVHGNFELLESILKDNKDVDLKIYLGDFQMNKANQEKFTQIFDHVVTGNCDYPNISPNTLFETIDGRKVLITHGHLFGSWTKKIDFDKLFNVAKENQCDYILHGHDHIAVEEENGNIIRFNPGSTTFPRIGYDGTYGIIETAKGKWKFKHIIC